ncbi:outer membrane transport energization protein TonB [Paraburkholderia sp. BL6669N2]|uniref:energy transducer TonB n=1 Tax=Paraburkholderia sp. BL6669N2 TaxID=1938807 RepID=UPI000E26D884|nr:energy transducer TonB [Paraburkholderia sp. BL6669N2]REG58611.1 outer membrane transport energization protein TonB [Paraburkholderia sp. BL6669N2]
MKTLVLRALAPPELKPGMRWPAAFAIALVIEGGLIAILGRVPVQPVAEPPPPPKVMKVVTITDAPVDPTPPQPARKAPPEPPKPAPVPHRPTPMRHVAPTHSAMPAPAVIRAPVATQAPATVPQAAPAVAPDIAKPTREAPPAASQAPKVRKGIVPLVRVEPDYPPRAMASNIEGSVIAHVTITRDGSVNAVSIVHSDPPKVFDQAAINALMRWKFSPGDADVVGEVELRFSLSE